VASQHFDGHIDWLVGSEDKADLLRGGISAGGLRSTGVITAKADRLRTVSADPAAVIPDADIVMIVVPAFVHNMVLRRIKPYINDATIIGCLPTRGGFEFEAAQLVPRYGNARRRIFGLQTLPWSTRVVTPGTVVNIGAAKAEVVLAASPSSDRNYLAARLSRILGTRVIPSKGFLNLTLGNPGQLIHPGLMYGHFNSWRGETYREAEIPMLYAEATDEMGEVVQALSDDAIAVARSIEEGSGKALELQEVAPVLEWLRCTYAHVTDDLTSVATCFRTGPIRSRKAPMVEISPGEYVPNFAYRYLTEDVPYGLVVTRALAQIVDVATPAIDDVIGWAQSAMQKIYLVGGKVAGPDARRLPIPQHHEVSSLDDLVDWYAHDASQGVPRSRVHAWS
jgi:hypothetical protein